MATRKPLVNVNGTNQQIPNADTLSVGVGIDAAAAGALAIGAATATSVVVTPNVGIGGAPTTKLDVTTGQLAVPDGTALLPSIVFRDDLNSGFFSPSNDMVGVAGAGVEVARFYSASGDPALEMGMATSVTGGFGAISVDATTSATTISLQGHASALSAENNSKAGGQFLGMRTRGTKAAPTQIQTGDGLANFVGAGLTDSDSYNLGALVTIKAEQAYTNTASGGRIEFHTTTNGTDGFSVLGGATTERMRVTNAGIVSVNGAPTASTKFQVIGSDATVNGITVGRGNTGAAATSTAIGVSALAVATGANNTAVGNLAADLVTTGTQNTAVGSSALGAAVTASNTTAIGFNALLANTAGENTAVGSLALDANTSGTKQVAVGYNALSAVVTGEKCTAVGHSALALSTASFNTAIGAEAGSAITSGENNVAVGRDALDQVSTQSNNTAIGDRAMTKSTCTDSTAVGAQALGTSTSTNCIAVGVSALASNTAVNCVAVGNSALAGNSGEANTAIGHLALDAGNSGGGNVAVGVNALGANTTGENSVAVGAAALSSATTGTNVAVGFVAGVNITTGTDNTALGSAALGLDVLSPGLTDTGNTAIGHVALGLLTGAASNNTALGYNAGNSVTTGSSLTLIGYNTQPTVGTLTNATALGADAAVTASNAIQLGNGSISLLRCQVALTVVSDARDKADVETLPAALPLLAALRPVKYRWDNRSRYDDGVSDGSKKDTAYTTGFIAQEIQQACASHSADWLNAVYDGDPEHLGVTHERLLPVVVKACQELAAKATAAEARADAAEARLAALEAAVAALQG